MTHADGIVFVVDDDASIRAALSSLIRSVGLQVETFATARELLERPQADEPSCLVLDVMLPGSSGLDLPEALSRLASPMPVIFITGHGTIPMSVRAMKAGAIEFLTKPVRDEDLLDAIQHALARDREARRQRHQLAVVRQRYEKLTPRERDVLALVITGRLNKQIAAELGTAEQTIKVHRARIMQKLEVGSVAELVHLSERVAGQPWATGAPEGAVVRK
jgi:FixJ family two-component response regulator